MTEMEEEVHSPVLSMLPHLEGEIALSQLDEHPTQKDTEMNNNQHNCQAII